MTPVDRVRACGRVPRGTTVGLRLEGGRAGFSGLATCGSPWACPVCAAKIAAHRAGELQTVLTWAAEQGHQVALLTLTMRHSPADALADCWAAATTGWSSVTSGGAWAGEGPRAFARRQAVQEARIAEAVAEGRSTRRFRPLTRRVGLAEAYGVLGWARAVEVTRGGSGWHVHVHAVVVFDRLLALPMVEDFGRAAFDLWLRGLDRAGFTALRDSGGLDVRIGSAEAEVGLSRYLTKSLVLEATHGHAKRARSGSRSPFELLDAAADGDGAALRAWREFAIASGGRRQLSWSRGLRELAGLAAEATDDQIADADLGTADLVYIPGAEWPRLAPVQEKLLQAAEAGGVAGAVAWLDARAIRWMYLPDTS